MPMVQFRLGYRNICTRHSDAKATRVTGCTHPQSFTRLAVSSFRFGSIATLVKRDGNGLKREEQILYTGSSFQRHPISNVRTRKATFFKVKNPGRYQLLLSTSNISARWCGAKKAVASHRGIDQSKLAEVATQTCRT
jgi:hypothetical protein